MNCKGKTYQGTRQAHPQRHHHLGHLFPCFVQYAGRVDRCSGEHTEAGLVKHNSQIFDFIFWYYSY